MNPSLSRRNFFKTSGVVSTSALLGSTSLVGCGSGSTADLSTAEQIALTATQAVAALKSGRLSATSYVTTLIARAKTVSDLNAMITLDEVGALAAAKQFDVDRAAGKTLGALAGLPIVVKDNINTKGMKTTGGTYSLRNFQPSSNAPSLQKLIDAGAIVLGKTNLHEWAFGITSTNFTLGIDPISKYATRPCKNPYDTSRIPGGSSGGTAVALAARFAPAGLGTDTGGSTRVPASFCGVAGFRPSVGDGVGQGRRYVDTNAVLPISTTRDTIGPMARTVADLALLDAVIYDSVTPTARSLKGLKIGIPSSFWAELDDSVATVATVAKQKLADAGVVFVEADLDGVMTLNGDISFQIALHEPVAAIPAYLVANGAPVTTVQAVSDQVASPDVQGAFSAILGDVYGSAYAEVIATKRPALQKLYADYFTNNGVEAVLFPTTILPAPGIDVVNGSSTLSYTVNDVTQTGKNTFSTCIRNTDPCTNAGIPSVSIPAGLTTSGLPVGMQIDGPLGSDANLLSIAMGMEEVWGSLTAPTI
ncbi:amidase [Limnohabitans sp. JirII-29]|uniref:indoleacetamide hydrolase n=1 Tax=Limnohabitans sp. JirII-29 TaxID=1835756 RepID=UPI000D335F26|nr:indoleacetamide hydrolase [Limnohabitans sp. JirII-29]PUE29260.1 amidase [Limnohabitans sp. JirII-29]